MTHSRSRIHRLLDSTGRSPRRDLGQNFVADPNTVRRIAELAKIGPGDRVIEIGAGLGSLTLALAETGASVTAVEVDRHLVPVLRQVLADTEVNLVEADAASLNWDTVLEGHDDWTLVANLPYNIATPLIADLLDHTPQITSMLIMIQKEVGERLAASPGTKAYGAVSVKVAYWARARIVAQVPPSVFVPRPRVNSVLVRIDRHTPPDVAPEAIFPLVRTAFGQRRKMIRRSLAELVSPPAFDAAGIDPTRRPETLSLDEWCQLAAAVSTSTSI